MRALLRVLRCGRAGVVACAAVGVWQGSMHAVAAEDGAMADKSGYWLLNPVPRELMRLMSTDRPDTTESAKTVDAGHMQAELSFVDGGYDGRNDEDVTTRTLSVMPMLLKVGVLNNVDVQLGIDPWTRATGDPGGGEEKTTDQGFGDMLLRVKVNLWGNDDEEEGSTALAVMPFLTFPTGADGIGSGGGGSVEGGVIVPFGAELPGGFFLGAMVEFDWLRSAADDRYVVDFVHTITLGHDLVGDLAGYIEFAGFANLNGDEDYRGLFDAGLTYSMTEDVQWDCGVRIGLTEAAEDFGVFAGISVRF